MKKNNTTLLKYFLVSISFLFFNELFSQTIENSFDVNVQVPKGNSILYFVQISGAPTNSAITNVEAKFTYTAFNGVQSYVYARFARNGDPGTSGGVSLVNQGNLLSGNPGTYGYVSLGNFGNDVPNSNYYFRIFYSGSSPHVFLPTISKIYVKVTYATVNVISPSGGQTWYKSISYPITWSTTNLNSSTPMAVHLIKGSNPQNVVHVFGNSIPNSGSYNAQIPNSLTNGSDYRIGISALSGKVWSIGNYFSINSGTLNLTSPTSGTVWQIGQTYNITWNSSNVNDVIAIDLFKGNINTGRLTSSALNTGSFPYNVSSSLSPGNDYNVRMSTINGTVFSLGNNFTINSPPPIVPSLISPVNSTVTTSQITFQWSDCNALRYELYVDNNSGFGSAEISKIQIPELRHFTSTSYTISGNWLEENVYYWKVVAIYANNTSGTSTVGTFTYSPDKLLIPDWVPVYRAYNSQYVDHFYCTSEQHLLTAINNGYNFEKVEGFLSLSPFVTQPSSDLKNVFRIFIGKHASHIYTSDPAVKDNLIIADTTNKYEGIIGYGLGSTNGSYVKMFYTYKNNSNPLLIDYFYTTSDVEKNNSIQNGYEDRGFIVYLSLSGGQGTEPWMEMQPEYGYGINAQNGNMGLYNKTSFNIPGAKTALSFMHIYNSYSTRLPVQSNQIGIGWTHNYMANITQNGGRLFVTWPGGGMHLYNLSDLKPVTPGVYDIMVKTSSTGYKITKKDQFVYSFDVLKSGDSTAFLKSIMDRNGNTLTCEYNNNERKLTKVTNQEGRYLTFNYYTDGPGKNLIKEVVDPITRTVKFEYDSDNNLIKFIDAKGNPTSYSYDPNARYDHLLTRINLPRGNFIENAFSGRKIISQKTDNGANTSIQYFSSYTKITDENFKSTELYYSSPVAGLLTRLVSGNLNSKFDYTSIQNPVKPTKITDGNGNETNISYDNMGNATQINKPLGITHNFTYNSMNDVTKYISPRGVHTNYTYQNGNLIIIQTSRGSTNISYNPNGTISKVTDPLSRSVNYSYNGNGDVTEIKDNLNNKTSYNYDGVSRIISMTDANNNLTTYSYDNNDLTTNVTKPGSININYSYDQNDKLTQISNPSGQITSLSYNAKDLLQNMMNSLSRNTTYEYNENGLLKSKKYPNNQITSFSYDNSNRQTGVSSSGTNGSITGTIAYDNNDNITSMSDNVYGNMNYSYDALNRLKSYSDYYGNSVLYAYDNSDNIISITYPGGRVVSYEYADDDLLTKVTDWNGKFTTYTYKTDGSLDEIIYPNQTRKTCTYDGAGRITGIVNKKSDGSIISSYNFTLDNVGNHTSVSQIEPYASPVLLSSSQQYLYNSGNQITTDSANGYSFDFNGNLTQKTGSVSSSYTYDWGNRLKSISGEYTASFGYDLSGNRRYSNIGGNIKKYILDINTPLPKVLMETDNNGNVLNYYVYGLELISRVKADGITTNFYHSDFRGSIVAMTDASQNITHKYSYGPYGEILQSNEANTNPFKYVGAYGVMEEGVGLYFMRARFYDAKIGRFISEDPVWDMNLYAYGDDNPMMKIDASGLTPSRGEEIFNLIYNSLSRYNDVAERTGLRKIPGFKRFDYATKIFKVLRYRIEKKMNPNGKTTDSKYEYRKTLLSLIPVFGFFIELEMDFIEMQIELAPEYQWFYRTYIK